MEEYFAWSGSLFTWSTVGSADVSPYWCLPRFTHSSSGYEIARVNTSAPVGHPLVDAALVWNPTFDGQFSVRSAYALASGSRPLPILGPPNHWRCLWKFQCLPKIRIFLWKLLSSALPTKAVINYRKSDVSASCVFCSSSMESLDHLFLFCPFARAVWFASDLSLRTSSLGYTSVQEWVVDWLLGKKFFAGMAFEQQVYMATVLWEIWKSRNDVLFGKKYRTPIQTLHNVRRMVNSQLQVKEMAASHLSPAPLAQSLPPDFLPVQWDSVVVFHQVRCSDFIQYAWFVLSDTGCIRYQYFARYVDVHDGSHLLHAFWDILLSVRNVGARAVVFWKPPDRIRRLIY